VYNWRLTKKKTLTLIVFYVQVPPLRTIKMKTNVYVIKNT